MSQICIGMQQGSDLVKLVHAEINCRVVIYSRRLLTLRLSLSLSLKRDGYDLHQLTNHTIKIL